tara:strand:- start:59 stop:400 length:342 start_codon:yes stop_codon:yes gene_type:complete
MECDTVFDIAIGNNIANWSVVFDNGWCVSVSHLNGTSSRERNTKIETRRLPTFGVVTEVTSQVPTVQVWVMHTTTKETLWKKRAGFKEDITPDKLAKIMSKVRKLPAPTQTKD